MLRCVALTLGSIFFYFIKWSFTANDGSSWKNDVLFLGKWRLVLWKTTCCFWENDGLFCEKRRVVFEKTTARFVECEGGRMDDAEKWNVKTGIWVVKKPAVSPPRARTRTRIYRSFRFFAVTSVTVFGVKHCLIACYDVFCIEFNNQVIWGNENQWKREGKACFSGLHFEVFRLFFLWFTLFFFLHNASSVTLVTAKIQHRCWKARALRVRTRILNMILQGRYIKFQASIK